MYIHNINPVLVSLGPLQIKYYSLAYLFGAIIVYFLVQFLLKEKKINLNKNKILDLIVYALLGVVIGGRLGYILFYNFFYYLSKPLEILAVWSGGMSFHGGLIGSFALVYYYCKKNNLEFWKIADIMVIPIAIALFLGRIGNFINGELYGRITTISWAVKFKGVDGFRHPSQIYEALKNLFIFMVLWFARKRKMADGILFSIFLIIYSVLRFCIEFFREPDIQIGLLFGLSRGQWFSIAMFITGIILYVKLNSKK
ncbi:MAG: prolipoprotein diacylglyceryl transferase [Nanoarchaeota archaeon]|nr:prolipoprotein diacylglyceryl transferase [Nanoarchaeota archaeon]MBU4242276.1 prolipoprotein diacylglyceryl transferase [Nanoarchaeota archaeon]MBU4352609.1 prolipoprotein diacylglyceryl transferase [Nanoarchaeota archaeon]